MKLFKYIKHASLSLAIVTMAGACTKDFEEVNSNPNGPTSVPAELLIPGMVERSADRLYSAFVGGDMGHCWAQLWSKVQYNDEARYNPRGSVIDVIWDDFYAGTLTDAVEMYNLAVLEENRNLQGIAIIMQAYSYSVLTDMYGDIPFSEAIKAIDGINAPIYDSQQAVYNGVLAMLDDANVLLSANGGDISSSSDILYAGDYSGWKKFGNSLKFRMLMRMSSAPGASVGADLQALVNAGGMFTSNANEAKLTYLESPPVNANPIYNSIIAGNREEYKVGEVIVNMLVADGDPRLAVYAQVNEDGIFRGKPAGIQDVPSDTWSYGNVSPIGELYVDPTAPAHFMSYAELQFLMAEAAQRGLISGSAATFFANGIAANLEANGLGAGAYTVAYDGTLGQIATQKWIALFGQGVEAWTEWRRTGFPALTPAIDAISISEIPSRYTYPSSEQSLNAASYTAASAAIGGDVLTTKVWWNK